jgi:hypothetical protein
MQDTQLLKAEIISSLEILPSSSLRTLAEFVAFLRERAGHDARMEERIIQLGGLWIDTADITAEDIAEARREMWGDLGKDDL